LKLRERNRDFSQNIQLAEKIGRSEYMDEEDMKYIDVMKKKGEESGGEFSDVFSSLGDVRRMGCSLYSRSPFSREGSLMPMKKCVFTL
jgi:hypothetical protein